MAKQTIKTLEQELSLTNAKLLSLQTLMRTQHELHQQEVTELQLALKQTWERLERSAQWARSVQERLKDFA